MSDFDFLRANLAWYKNQYDTARDMLTKLGVPEPQGSLVYRLGLVNALPYQPKTEPIQTLQWHHTGGRLQ